MIRVYRYALRAPLDWGRDCEAEIERMQALWARLVRIEADHQYATQRLMERDSALGHLNGVIAAAEMAKDWPALKAARAEAKVCAAAQRKAKKAELAALETARREAVKQARKESGCYWGQYNHLIQSYETARQRVITRGHNLYPRLQSQRLTVQIQGGMSVRDLMGGGNSQLAILPSRAVGAKPDWRTLRMLVHNSGGAEADLPSRRERLRAAHWPMIMHRPIPEDAVIVGAQICRRPVRTMSDDAAWVWTATITVREPDRAGAAPQGAAGVAFGWRRCNAGIVAAIVRTGGGVREIVLPNDLIALQDRVEALTSRIDRRLGAARALMAGLDPMPEAASTALAGGDRLTIGALERALAAWGEEPPEALVETARANRRDRLERDGLNRRLPLWRREIYRLAARDIARDAGVVAIADIDWARAAQSLRWRGRDEERRLRRIAAPGEAEAELRRAVHAAGGCVEAVAIDGADDGAPAEALFAAARASADAVSCIAAALAPEKSMAYEGRYQRARRMAAEKNEALENGAKIA